MKHLLLFTIILSSSLFYAQDVVNKGTVISIKDSSLFTEDELLNEEGTIIGNGTISSSLFGSDGTISPGFSIGTITVNDALALSSMSVLVMEIEGDAGKGALGGNDFIQVEKSIELAGELVIDVPTAFTPELTDRFILMTYDASDPNNLVAEFDTLTLDPAFDGWEVSYGLLNPGVVELVPAELLPVKLVLFTATKVEETALLEWETASEINNEGFEVQQSTDGINWTSIGWVDGARNSTVTINYSFIHQSPSTGINYYRLKQIDFDGQFEYTNIEQLHFDHQKFTLYPNPAIDELYLVFDQEEEAFIRIIDINGQIVQQIEHYQSNQMIDISNLAKGSFILELKTETESTNTIFIKQ